MGQAFGRRLSLILVAPIFAVSFICQAAAQDVALLQFGRLLSGLAAGLVSAPAAVSYDDNKGLGSDELQASRTLKTVLGIYTFAGHWVISAS